VIAIIDNGCRWSDREIWFVEVESGDEARAFVDVVGVVRPHWSDAKILLTAESVTWWHGKATTVDDFLRTQTDEMMDPDPEDLPRFDAIPMAWMERLDRTLAASWMDYEGEHWRAYIARRRAA
jgi:hypothetical protein